MTDTATPNRDELIAEAEQKMAALAELLYLETFITGPGHVNWVHLIWPWSGGWATIRDEAARRQNQAEQLLNQANAVHTHIVEARKARD
jgi:hypothetical protein